MPSNVRSITAKDALSFFHQAFDEELRAEPALDASEFHARLNCWAVDFQHPDGGLPHNISEAQNRITAAWQNKASELDLADLQLESLPDVIAHLPHLEALKASGNRLQKFPDWLDQLHELKLLDLSRNVIRSNSRDLLIPDSLQKVALHDNPHLTHFPKALVSLMRSREVEVSCHNTGIHPGEQDAIMRRISGELPRGQAPLERALASATLSRSLPIGIPGRSSSHDRLSPSETESLFKSGHEVMSSSVKEKISALQRSQSSSGSFDPSLWRPRNHNPM